METSILSSTHKYAATALFSLALHQSQIHQKHISSSLCPLKQETVGLGVSVGNDEIVSDDSDACTHELSCLLSPVARFLGVDEKARHGLKETATMSSQVRHHVGAFMTLLSDESDETSSERIDKEMALIKVVDTTVLSIEKSHISSDECGKTYESMSSQSEVYCQDKHFSTKIKCPSGVAEEPNEEAHLMPMETKFLTESEVGYLERAVEEEALLSDQRKVVVLYELLSACLADHVKSHTKCSQQGKGYDARYRVALRLLATWLNIKWIKMEALEILVACSLMDSLKEKGAHVHEEITSSAPSIDWKMGGLVGAAALTGGTVMAVTGGLAAPAIAHGLGVLAPALGSVAPAVGTVAGEVTVAASFGAAGASYTGSKMARRIGNLDDFEFMEVGNNHNNPGSLAVGVFISGFVLEDPDFTRPWEGYMDNMQRYALKWESQNLIALTRAIQDWFTSQLAIKMMKEGAMLTVLSALVAALSVSATLLTAADLIDSKWAVGVDRADKAGKVLAESLLQGLQGNRPVTLVGFSLGARLIFRCLQCLAENNNVGIVERVVLLGTPVSIKDEKWEDARRMVAGRFVNAYSSNDWTLGIALRANLLTQGLAGIQPVEGGLGIENVDVTEIINGHSCYLSMTSEILKQLDIDNYNTVFTTVHTTPPEDKKNQ